MSHNFVWDKTSDDTTSLDEAEVWLIREEELLTIGKQTRIFITAQSICPSVFAFIVSHLDFFLTDQLYIL